MDQFNLKTASAYINNLLLARGLQRNGKAIEFARPSKGEGGTEATMAQIINLVHDLILRRDREQEHRETVAQTLRSLRADVSRTTLSLERLQTRNDDLARQLSLSQSQERAARAAVRTAEASARALREEIARLKVTVQQVRNACANDVRKRDVQIQRLKTHLTSHQRGNKTGLVGASIVITPGVSGPNSGASAARAEEAADLDDPGYSLRQETTEFLTQLSQSLSDENDNLIGLVRSTLATLRELQGLPESMQRAGQAPESTGQEEEQANASMVHALPMSYDSLATDMDNVLENLRNLLTNPNFVPIDEVEVREEEIVRLREGWEKMEARWREAVTLMDGWRKRMLSGGDTVNLEELKMGLGLGEGFSAISSRGEPTGPVEDDVDTEGDEDDVDKNDDLEEEDEDVDENYAGSGDESSAFDEVTVNDSHSHSNDDKDSGVDLFDIKLHPQQPTLKEGDGNARSPRKVTFAPSHPSTPHLNQDENAPEPDLLQPSTSNSSATKQLRNDGIVSKITDSRKRRKSLKRHSSPHVHPDERSPKLTVQEKLDAAQAEAEAAAVAASLRVKDVEPANSEVTAHANEKANGVVATKVMALRASPKKTRIGGRPRRRKSTLSPEELENLLLGGG